MVPATQMIENVVGVIRQNASKSPLMVKNDNCYLKLLSKVPDIGIAKLWHVCTVQRHPMMSWRTEIWKM